RNSLQTGVGVDLFSFFAVPVMLTCYQQSLDSLIVQWECNSGSASSWYFNVIGDKSLLQCAGLNRHEAEEEEASRERTSDPLGPEFLSWVSRDTRRSVNRGIGGVGIELRKDAIRTPTLL